MQKIFSKLRTFYKIIEDGLILGVGVLVVTGMIILFSLGVLVVGLALIPLMIVHHVDQWIYLHKKETQDGE